MTQKWKNRIPEYHSRKIKHSQYVNEHLKFFNKQEEINAQLKKLGFINLPMEKLRKQYAKQLKNEGYLSKDIEKLLVEEYKSKGITKYNRHEIKKLRNKLIHIQNYIRFLERKVSRTN